MISFNTIRIFVRKSHAQIVVSGFVVMQIFLTIIRSVAAKDTGGLGGPGDTVDEAVRDV